MDTTSATECPRCNRPVTAGLRECPACGFDLIWDQAMVTTATIDSGAFMTTASIPNLGTGPVELLTEVASGEYEILGELGRGGMAAVFLAREIALDRKVAIKLISPSFLDGAEAVERFKREARTAASLSHPGVIPIYGVRETDRALYFVMKYVHGRTLASILRSAGPLPVTLVRAVLASVANALDYAHRNGVIHRDIKPGNIMVDVEGHVMVTDFGIAKVVDSQGLTMTGRTIGTPAYMSPESCVGREVTGASDQYALGVVGYELLAGRNPFLADNSVGIMYAHVHESPQPIGELRPDCPPEMAAAIMRMIDKNVAVRFPTLKEAAQAIQGAAGLDEMAVVSLGALAASRGPSGDHPTPTPVPRRTPVTATPTAGMMHKRTTAWLLIATVVILGSVVTGLLYVARRQRPVTTAAADSALTTARASAFAARARGRAAGFAPALMAGGDSVMSAAEVMVDSGRTAEAAALFTAAAAIWDSIPQRTGRSQSTTAGPARVREPQPEAAPPATESITDSAAIVHYYRELALGIQSRQLGEVRRLLPNLDRFAEDAWRRMFEDDDVTRIEANYQVLNLTRTDGQVHARIHENLVVIKNDRPNPKARTFFATLTLGPQGWRQIREEK